VEFQPNHIIFPFSACGVIKIVFEDKLAMTTIALAIVIVIPIDVDDFSL
jgi:hypothetical protein